MKFGGGMGDIAKASEGPGHCVHADGGLVSVAWSVWPGQRQQTCLQRGQPGICLSCHACRAGSARRGTQRGHLFVEIPILCTLRFVSELVCMCIRAQFRYAPLDGASCGANIPYVHTTPKRPMRSAIAHSDHVLHFAQHVPASSPMPLYLNKTRQQPDTMHAHTQPRQMTDTHTGNPPFLATRNGKQTLTSVARVLPRSSTATRW